MRHFLLIIVALLLAVVPAEGRKRTSSSVRKQKQQTERRISETGRRISKNQTDITRRLNQVNWLQAQIDESEQAIRRLNAAVDSLGRQSAAAADSIARFEARLALMRSRYADAARRTRKNRRAMSAEAFLFSAESFRQAYRRYRYMEQYSEWRERTAGEITALVGQLTARRARLEVMQAERRRVLTELDAERRQLQGRRDSTTAIVASLRREGSALKKALARQEAEARALDEELDRLIAAEAEAARKAAEEEARRRAEEERRNAAASADVKKSQDASGQTTTKPKVTPPPVAGSKTPPVVDRKLSGSFADNKGRLPWPVTSRYSIVKKFGRQKHPTLPHVEIDNPGIDLHVPGGTEAKAVFAGKVTAIFRQDGYGLVVLVRHGEYLTVYANLASLGVKTGDSVKAGQSLGTLGSADDGSGRASLHFEIRREKRKYDPLLWLK